MMFIKKLIATGGGLGYIPPAPGTMGALGGWIAAIGIQQYSDNAFIWLFTLIVLFFFLGVWVSGNLEQVWGKDPSRIVIDEIVGIWISVIFLPTGWIPMIAAFILFRLFDIYKPLFINKAEQLKGGWGIMADDVLAGIYTNLSLQLIYFIIRWLN
jgi:phosphatidylglycerophosphatase A